MSAKVFSLEARRQLQGKFNFSMSGSKTEFFNATEAKRLVEIIMPYVEAGLITNFTFQRGQGNSAFFAKCGEGDKEVVFCVCKRGGRGVPKYGVSMHTPDAFETVNFSEVVKYIQPALENLSVFARAEKKRIAATNGTLLRFGKG